jgi:hypothetical protein
MNIIAVLKKFRMLIRLISNLASEAKNFYGLLQKQAFDWTVFELDSTSLGRFDINYLRQPKRTDLSEEIFFQETIQKLEEKKRTYSLDNLSHSSKILSIGKRASSRFYQIYTLKKETTLKFEFEIKGTTAKSFQDDLFSNRLEDFEQKVSDLFYKHSKGLLPVENSYTDWLLVHYRKTRKRKDRNIGLVTTYLESTLSKNQSDRERLWKLFQLLTFIHNLKDSQKVRKVLRHQVYYEISFQLQDFVQFTGVKKNQYQLKKAKAFLETFYNFQKTQGVINQI